MRESGSGATPVGLFVISHEVGVNDGQATGDVHFDSDDNELAQKNTDCHPRRNKPDLLPQTVFFDRAPDTVDNRQRYFQCHRLYHPHK